MEIVKKGSIRILTSEKIKAKHGFTLRDGGVSEGEYGTLNLGLRRGDNPFNVFKNLEICCDCMKLCKENLTLTNQLHTSCVEVVTEGEVGKGLVREWTHGADGVVTRMEDVPIMCYSADCVPILLCDKNSSVIGAVHSGWRGTAENIVKNAVLKICEEKIAANDICAFVGPAIGMCCYEVSESVAEKFFDYADFVRKKDDGKYMLDLKSIVKKQLVDAGVLEENIDVAPYCTSCDNEMFFSHRKQNGKSGLLGGFIQL